MACGMWDTRIAEMAYFLLIDTVKGYNFSGNIHAEITIFKLQYVIYNTFIKMHAGCMYSTLQCFQYLGGKHMVQAA